MELNVGKIEEIVYSCCLRSWFAKENARVEAREKICLGIYRRVLSSPYQNGLFKGQQGEGCSLHKWVEVEYWRRVDKGKNEFDWKCI